VVSEPTPDNIQAAIQAAWIANPPFAVELEVDRSRDRCF